MSLSNIDKIKVTACTRTWLRNLFRGDNQKKIKARGAKKQELSFLHTILLLDLVYIPTNNYQIISNSMRVMACRGFCFREHKYIMKKVGVVSLACDTPTVLIFAFYQILSKYFKPLGSYGVHKNLAKKFAQGRYLEKEQSKSCPSCM